MPENPEISRSESYKRKRKGKKSWPKLNMRDLKEKNASR